MHMSRLFRSVCAGAALLVASLAHAGPYTSMVVFGDSLSDLGNIATITGGAVPGAPYSGAFTNGAPWVNGAAATLGLSPLGPSLLGGSDYAWGGARTNGHSNPALATTASIQAQVGAYLGSHGNAADPGALYVLWGGANDLQDALFAAAANPANALAIVSAGVTGSISRIGDLLDDLIGAGAGTIVVPNLPDLGLTPRIAAFGSLGVSLGNFASTLFNGLLDGVLAARSGSADLREADIFGLLNDAVANPAKYGLSNVNAPCYTGDDINWTGGGSVCADPGAYLFWDTFHPTAAAHAFIAAEIAQVAIPAPGVLLLFAAGLPLVRRERRRADALAA